MSRKLKGITIKLDGTNTDIQNTFDNYDTCPDCGKADDYSVYYQDNGLHIIKCNTCKFRITGYGTPLFMSKRIDCKQLDAIHSYIQRLELYLLDAGIQLPNNREDVDWQLFEPNVV
ncbi:hypothetical protein [Lysinibacillus agricola]|uniref:hypothetical protein n=1 Tax=Lysinibacillus agricola TaxID=2590012 RepID=UPI003C1D73D4